VVPDDSADWVERIVGGRRSGLERAGEGGGGVEVEFALRPGYCSTASV
jgi:hypothetical protein